MSSCRRWLSPFLSVVAGSVLLVASGCSLPPALARSPQQRLVDMLLSTWASSGHPFMEGVVGTDTIGAVKKMGDRSRNVTLPGAGGGQSWSIEITRADVLPVHAGPAFTKWLGTRSAATGERVFLPASVAELLTSGKLQAVGDVEATYGRADEEGRSRIQRVAYLMADPDGKDSRWVLQPETFDPVTLRNTLVRVYADMIQNNDAVLTCLGEAEVGADPRPTQLECIKKEIDLEFK